MKTLLEWILGLFVLAIVVGGAYLVWRPAAPAGKAVSVVASSSPSERAATSSPQAPIHFEVVTSVADQERGLGGRPQIPDDFAMLFVFSQSGRYGFWMKDMLVPIDIIWLRDDGSVMLVDHSVDPATYPQVFYPPQPVRYVLETKAGFAREHGWDTGTKVPLPAPYGS